MLKVYKETGGKGGKIGGCGKFRKRCLLKIVVNDWHGVTLLMGREFFYRWLLS